MNPVFQILLRHPIRFLILLLVPPLVGVAIAYLLPASYQASTSLWAIQDYTPDAISSSTTQATTPAAMQVAMLQELLQSRTFDLAVAKPTRLSTTLKLSSTALADSQQLGDAIVTELSHNVLVTAVGDNLYTISYQSPDPTVARQVVDSVITVYQQQHKMFATTGYQLTLLQSATDDVSATTQAENQYLLQHPALRAAGAAPLSDPNYALLDMNRVKAEATLQEIRSHITTTQQTTDTSSPFNVLDPPLLPDKPVSRLKSFLTAGGIGLTIALGGEALYLFALTRKRTMSVDVLQTSPFPAIINTPRSGMNITEKVKS